MKGDSEALFIKECIPSVIYLEGGFERPSLPICHPAIVYVHTKAQSRATKVGSSIGHRKLQTVCNKLLFIQPHRLGAAAAAVAAMVVACGTKRGHPQVKPCAAVGSNTVDAEEMVSW